MHDLKLQKERHERGVSVDMNANPKFQMQEHLKETYNLTIFNTDDKLLVNCYRETHKLKYTITTLVLHN